MVAHTDSIDLFIGLTVISPLKVCYASVLHSCVWKFNNSRSLIGYLNQVFKTIALLRKSSFTDKMVYLIPISKSGKILYTWQQKHNFWPNYFLLAKPGKNNLKHRFRVKNFNTAQEEEKEITSRSNIPNCIL